MRDRAVDNLYAAGALIANANLSPTPTTYSEAARDNWLRMATQWLRVAVQRRQLFCFTVGDAALLAFRSDLPSPPDSRAWGGVMQRAQKEGIIRRFVVKGVQQTATSKARHQTALWVRG